MCIAMHVNAVVTHCESSAVEIVFWKIIDTHHTVIEAVAWSHCHMQGAENIYNKLFRMACFDKSNDIIRTCDWHDCQVDTFHQFVPNQWYVWGQMKGILLWETGRFFFSKQSWPRVNKTTAEWAHQRQKWAHALTVKAVKSQLPQITPFVSHSLSCIIKMQILKHGEVNIGLWFFF